MASRSTCCAHWRIGSMKSAGWARRPPPIRARSTLVCPTNRPTLRSAFTMDECPRRAKWPRRPAALDQNVSSSMRRCSSSSRMPGSLVRTARCRSRVKRIESISTSMKAAPWLSTYCMMAGVRPQPITRLAGVKASMARCSAAGCRSATQAAAQPARSEDRPRLSMIFGTQMLPRCDCTLSSRTRQPSLDAPVPKKARRNLRFSGEGGKPFSATRKKSSMKTSSSMGGRCFRDCMVPMVLLEGCLY